MSEQYFIEKMMKSVIDEYQKDDIVTASKFCLQLFNAANNGFINYDNSNFYILQENDNMDKAIRLASLMPTTLTLTNINSRITEIDNTIIYSDEKKRFVDCAVYCHVPATDFTRIFSSASDLFISGIVKYYPNTIEIIGTDKEIVDETYLIREPKGCMLGEIGTKDERLMASYEKLLNVNIPYVFDIPLELFSKITVEHMDSLEKFKEFFSTETLRIDFSKKNEKLSFEYELQNKTHEIEKCYKSSISRLIRKGVSDVFGIVGVTVISFSDVSELTKALFGLSGLGKGLTDLCGSIFDYYIEKKEIKNKECYFLWLLKKAKIK